MNWLYLINSAKSHDIENLSGIEPINKTVIGGLHQWGVKRDKTINTVAASIRKIWLSLNIKTGNLHITVIVYLTSKLSKDDEFVFPHNKITVSKTFLTNKLHVFREDLPIIDMDSLI